MPLVGEAARRLRDMGRSPWLLLAPLALMLVTFAIYLGYFSMGETLDLLVRWIALPLTAAFMLWGSVSPGKVSPPSHG